MGRHGPSGPAGPARALGRVPDPVQAGISEDGGTGRLVCDRRKPGRGRSRRSSVRGEPGHTGRPLPAAAAVEPQTVPVRCGQRPARAAMLQSRFDPFFVRRKLFPKVDPVTGAFRACFL